MEFTTENLGKPPDVPAWNARRAEYPDVIPSLKGALLTASNLRGINLARADLREAEAASCDFTGADLSNASLAQANLREANLEHVDLRGVNFYGANLDGVSLRGSILGETVFCNVDLSKVGGLEECTHEGPSSVDFATLFRSKARIPERFLIGCGLAHAVIENLPALVASLQPIQFYSCFISYSEKDRDFAEQLHKSLTSLGIRAWFAPENLRIGRKIAAQIDEAIRIHDKLLLVLSNNSVNSDWVEREVETALERERRERRSVLFPLRLDDAALVSQVAWAEDVRRSRHIADFRGWTRPKDYEKALSRLARDLALASSAEMSEGSNA
jgi:TIR domain/Pentapeptide repeats (8 copies)